MNILNQILEKRLKFAKQWKRSPDILVLTTDQFNDIQSPSMNRICDGYIFNMKIELGDRMDCKFEPTIQI